MMPARRIISVAITLCNLLVGLADNQKHNRYQNLLSVGEKPEQSNTPEMKYDALPKSPPHERDITPGDLHESIDYAAQKTADWTVKNFGGMPEGDPGKFYGGSCKEVCAACFIAADPEYPSCNCRASCEMGPDSTTCPKKLRGWLNKNPTAPESRWKAVCNAGQRDCNSCVDAEAKAEIEHCRKERIPALCFHRLKMRYGSSKATTRFCTRSDINICEKFFYAPKENGWTCYDDEATCNGSLRPASAQELQDEALREARERDDKNKPLPTPCIWCSIPIK